MAPAAHYHMGGIFTDSLGRSTVDGLWACGEAASTGVHGANRLASNSLLEAIVFARRAAADIKERVKVRPGRLKVKLPFDFGSRFTAQGNKRPDDRDEVSHIRQIMNETMGVSRNGAEMRLALKKVHRIMKDTPENITVQNMALSCTIMLVAALDREESRGGHFRTDFAETSNHFAHRTMINLRQARQRARYYMEQDDEGGPKLKLVVGH